MKREFSQSKMKEVIGQVTSKRVSGEAAAELNRELYDFGEELVQEALEYTKADGRKTIRAEDLRNVIRDREL